MEIAAQAFSISSVRPSSVVGVIQYTTFSQVFHMRIAPSLEKHFLSWNNYVWWTLYIVMAIYNNQIRLIFSLL